MCEPYRAVLVAEDRFDDLDKMLGDLVVTIGGVRTMAACRHAGIIDAAGLLYDALGEVQENIAILCASREELERAALMPDDSAN